MKLNAKFLKAKEEEIQMAEKGLKVLIIIRSIHSITLTFYITQAKMAKINKATDNKNNCG